MSRGTKRRTPSVNDEIEHCANDGPCAKRHKRSQCEPDSDPTSDDNTSSTTSQSVLLTASPHLHHTNLNPPPRALATFEPNMMDLGIEFPSLPQVLNAQTTDDLALDSKFDLAQFAQSQTKSDANCKPVPFPMIFNWKELTAATNPQQLRTEALRKQERGKYVRRDSLSSEQAADRRRRQNRESARRTRDRVRKYITVLEMYYAHVQKVNSLLIKQLEVMAKHCTHQLTDEERANVKTYAWPQPPTIEECMNAKPATVSATSTAKKPGSDIENSPLQLSTNSKKPVVVANGTKDNTMAMNMNMKFENMPLKLPTLRLSHNALNINNHNKQNAARTSQINIMQMNHHNNMNILNQIQAINTMNNNNNNVHHAVNTNLHNGLNALKPFEQELLQCGVSLNPTNAITGNNAQYLIRPVVNPVNNVLTFQTIPNNNVLTLRRNALPTQFNNFNMVNGH